MKKKQTKKAGQTTAQRGASHVATGDLLGVLAEELRAEARANWKRAGDMSGPEECKTVWLVCDALAACIERTLRRHP